MRQTPACSQEKHFLRTCKCMQGFLQTAKETQQPGWGVGDMGSRNYKEGGGGRGKNSSKFTQPILGKF